MFVSPLTRESLQSNAVLHALSKRREASPSEIENFIMEMMTMGKVGEGVRLISIQDLKILRQSASPAVQLLVDRIIDKRRHIAYYKESGRFNAACIESVLRWCDRKTAHRTFLVRYAGNVDTIHKEKFHDYIEHEVLDQLPKQDNRFLDYAYCIVCTEGLFMSVRTHNDTCQIKSILASTIMDEIDEGCAFSDPSNDDRPLSNWYTRQNVCRIYQEFKATSSNGMISFDELLRAHEDTLNHVFITGFWENVTLWTKDDAKGKKIPALDFRGFVHFERALFLISNANSLAPRNKDGPDATPEYTEVLHFVFRCLARGKNYWNEEDIDAIVQGLTDAIGRYDICLFDQLQPSQFKLQMLDFLQPQNSDKYTFADLMNLDKNLEKTTPEMHNPQRSNFPRKMSQASLVLGCLVDASMFVRYDTRDCQ